MLAPLADTTVTSTVPEGWGGEMAVIERFDVRKYAVAGTVPNSTEVTGDRKRTPVMVTDWPPRTEPELGITAVTSGGFAAAAGGALPSVIPTADAKVAAPRAMRRTHVTRPCRASTIPTPVSPRAQRTEGHCSAVH